MDLHLSCCNIAIAQVCAFLSPVWRTKRRKVVKPHFIKNGLPKGKWFRAAALLLRLLPQSVQINRERYANILIHLLRYCSLEIRKWRFGRPAWQKRCWLASGHRDQDRLSRGAASRTPIATPPTSGFESDASNSKAVVRSPTLRFPESTSFAISSRRDFQNT